MKISCPRFALLLSLFIFQTLHFAKIAAQECKTLSARFALAEREVADLTALSADIFLGREGEEWTAPERLCVLHEIEVALMQRFAYEPLIALGRQLDMLTELKAPITKAQQFTNYEYLAKAYSELGVADSCVYFSDKAEALLDPTQEEELAELLRIRQPKLMGYIELLQFDRAEEMLAESEGWVRATGKERAEWGRLYYDRAVIKYLQGDFKTASSILDDCIRLIEFDITNNKDMYVNSLASKGKMLSVMGKLDDSESMLKKALDFGLKNPDVLRRGLIITYMNLSQLFTYKKDRASVERYFALAEELAMNNRESPFLPAKLYLFQASNISDFEDLEGTLMLCSKGTEFLKKSDLGFNQKSLNATLYSATSHFANQLFNKTKDSLILQKITLPAIANLDYLKFASVYSNYSGKRISATKIEEWEVEEILNAVRLLDSKELGFDKMAYAFDVIGFVKAQQIDFSFNVKELRTENTVGIKTAKSNRNLNLQLFSIKEAMEDGLLVGVEKEHESEQLFKRISNENVEDRYNSFLEFGSKLDIDFVSYFVQRDKLKILHFQNGIMSLNEVDISRDSLEELTMRLMMQIQEFKIDSVSPKEFAKNSKQLYDVLLGSILKKNSGNLVIVPHDFLNLLPFEVLCFSSHKENYSWDLPYLINQFDISYANSLKSFQFQEMQSLANKEHTLLALAPKFENHTDLRAIRSELSNLKFNTMEAKFVANLSNGILLEGNDANVREFSRYCNSASVVHFATHSFMDSVSQIPSVVISGNEIDDDKYIKLDLIDFFESTSSPNLAVLSACQTALGPVKFGDGVISIPQGMMKNGVGAVVSSLWEINDKTSMQIVKDFYSNLHKDENISKSLSNSKRKFLSENTGISQHPYFWAALISSGRISSNGLLKRSSAVIQNKFLICGCAIVILCLGMIFLKRINNI